MRRSDHVNAQLMLQLSCHREAVFAEAIFLSD